MHDALIVLGLVVIAAAYLFSLPFGPQPGCPGKTNSDVRVHVDIPVKDSKEK